MRVDEQATVDSEVQQVEVAEQELIDGKCWLSLSVARKPTGVNSVDSRVTRKMANSSINQASHGHCAGVFIGT
jgi:hypothetical protein